MSTKEEIYDAQIEPLMAQILAICKQSKIAMIASFSLDGDMLCTSLLLEDEYDPPTDFLTASATIIGTRLSPASFAITVSTPKESGATDANK